MTAPIEVIVEDGEAGVRLDKVLATHLPSGSRRQASQLLREGGALLNGRRVPASHLARAGDRLSVVVPVSRAVVPDDSAAVPTLLERADLVVVDKPGGIPTAPLRPGERGTVASALVHRYPEMVGVGHDEREPGLIHRLDTGTSGVLMAARDAATFSRLAEALRSGQLDKRYLAIVEARGLPGQGLVDEPLLPAGRRGQRVTPVAAKVPGAHDATTLWTKLRVHGPWAVVEVSAPHAYRHQIRAHLAWLGHPIAGDALYGGPAAGLPDGRHALHASYVAWAGAAGTAGFAVEAALPEDLDTLLRD